MSREIPNELNELNIELSKDISNCFNKMKADIEARGPGAAIAALRANMLCINQSIAKFYEGYDRVIDLYLK